MDAVAATASGVAAPAVGAARFLAFSGSPNDHFGPFDRQKKLSISQGLASKKVSIVRFLGV